MRTRRWSNDGWSGAGTQIGIHPFVADAELEPGRSAGVTEPFDWWEILSAYCQRTVLRHGKQVRDGVQTDGHALMMALEAADVLVRQSIFVVEGVDPTPVRGSLGRCGTYIASSRHPPPFAQGSHAPHFAKNIVPFFSI